MAVRIGTSGWIYKHWRGVFYPEGLAQKQWFGYYAREFDTVEINNSFYRLPDAAAFKSWASQAPPGFLYSVKASRFITHMKKLKDPEEPLSKFFEAAAPLGKSLGPLLYQLPPNWRVNLSRLEHFLSSLPRGPVHVVEFRNSTWLTEEVFRLMERYEVAHCIHDILHLDVPMRVTAPTVYIRLHGALTNNGDYTPSELKAWAERIRRWNSRKMDVFTYFNNDIGGYAVANAALLKKLLGA